MSYNFIKFDQRNKRFEDRITVTRHSSIGLPTKFFEDNKIKEFQYVVLYYDPAERALGLHFTNDEQEKAKFKIIRSKAGYGGSITARSFFTVNNIDVNKVYGRYKWEPYTIEGVGQVFVIKLQDRQETQKIESQSTQVNS